MEYLNPATLKLLTYLIYQEGEVIFGVLNFHDRFNFLKDIEKNKLEKYFFFTAYPLARDVASHKLEQLLAETCGNTDGRYAKGDEELLEEILNGTETEPKLATSDTISLINKHLMNNEVITFSLIIHLVPAKKAELNKFLATYIKEFEQNKLTSMKNYFSYEKHLELLPSYLLKEYYAKFGKTFTLNEKLEHLEVFQKGEDTLSKGDIANRKSSIFAGLRFYELMLFLKFNNLITLNNCEFIGICPTQSETQGEELPEKHYLLNIKITVNKTPSEMHDISKYWTHYGDIRVNETDAVAFYNDTRYPFKATSGKAFKLLCYLVEHHGEKVSVTQAYNAIISEEDSRGDKEKGRDHKNKIKDYVKEIKKNLGISKDKKASVDIMIKEDSVILISNPPTK